jgi:four helix bundle protein
MAISSLSEVDCQIEISKDLHFIDQETYQEISDLIITTQKIINGLIRSLSNYQVR